MKLITAAAMAALLATPVLAAEPESCADGAFLRRRLDRHHRHYRGRSTVLRGARLRDRRRASSRCRSPTPGSPRGTSTSSSATGCRPWRPTRAATATTGRSRCVRANLEGAKYTLAVPTDLADAGLKDFADIAKFGDQLDWTIYGIEPGNDGNRLILDMIASDKFGLGKFELKESSRAGDAGRRRGGRRRAARGSSSSAGSRTR